MSVKKSIGTCQTRFGDLARPLGGDAFTGRGRVSAFCRTRNAVFEETGYSQESFKSPGSPEELHSSLDIIIIIELM
ncbi:hypothetical protein EYF80_019840 [Liparis tanakae]|uniref:Uncharacterized protein n=1 Tax=Liparis tanakae TaxID=230148 RepID=A0A4Z2HW97_9TELE|nr:hypothetical protein EYF80_019840 [Liparis tanakae]